jgi:hypothetical protein
MFRCKNFRSKRVAPHSANVPPEDVQKDKSSLSSSTQCAHINTGPSDEMQIGRPAVVRANISVVLDACSRWSVSRSSSSSQFSISERRRRCLGSKRLYSAFLRPVCRICRSGDNLFALVTPCKLFYAGAVVADTCFLLPWFFAHCIFTQVGTHGQFIASYLLSRLIWHAHHDPWLINSYDV